MADRMPPCDINAEKSALGAAMTDRDAMADILEKTREEDFFSGANREIFHVMKDLFTENTPVDLVTVCDELKKRGSLEKVGGRAYVGSLCQDVPSTANASEYAKIVSEKATLRSLIKTAEDIKDKSFKENVDAEAILDYAEKNIFDIAQQKQTKDYAHIKEVLIENMNMLNQAINSKGTVTGLATGYKKMDTITSGFQKSDLVIIAARPAMGKTAFALNIALNAATKANASVLIFSLEMSKAQLGQRLLSMESRVEMQRLKTGKIERNDWERINLALDSLSRANINIDDTAGISVLEMKNKCRRLKAEKGLDLVVVDYLQLMQMGGKAESRQQEISALSRYLKLLAKEMDCPVIVLSQLSRAPEMRQDHRPVLSDLRESGSIEQDADMVMFLYRDDYYNPDDSEKPGVCEVNLAKHRSGPTDTIELTWVERYTKFSDMAQ